jgi:hypothetical protein
VIRAVVRRESAAPVRILTRQGWRLELLGLCWEVVRTCSSIERGMGVGRKARVECHVESTEVTDACCDLQVVCCSWVEGAESMSGFSVIVEDGRKMRALCSRFGLV